MERKYIVIKEQKYKHWTAEKLEYENMKQRIANEMLKKEDGTCIKLTK